MRYFRDLSIRKKLFAAILVILLINFLLLVLLGSTLFQSFYEKNKVNELQKSARALSELYAENSEQSWDELYSQIFTAENRNSTIMIFQLNEAKTEPEVVYHSRMRSMVTITPALPADESEHGEEKTPYAKDESTEPATEIQVSAKLKLVKLDNFPAPEWETVFSFDMVKNLPDGDKQIVMEDSRKDHGRGSRITLMSKLDDNLYLMMETPKEYIKTTADLAVLYTSVISIAILFVGALALYYISGRFTRPICEIDAVAKQIALMDFSQSCHVRSGDEIGTLAASVNHMSEELAGNMEKLIAANNVLKEDLARQQETDRIRRQFMS